jgi:homeobox protein cut-like
MASKAQSQLAFWQELALPAFQRQLDDVADEITARQDDSEASKLALVAMLKEFKRDQPEDVRLAAAPLVKAFQNEVDSLARRSKGAEKAFFETYKRLTDMTDPVPVLEQALEAQKSLGKVADMEIEVKQLRETLADYNKEIQEHKAKEKKLNELKAKVEAYDKNIDETLQEKIKDVTASMLEEYNEKVAAVQEEKETLKKRTAEAEQRASAAQRQLREAREELFEAQRGRDETRSARAEEMDMLTEDLDKANQRAAAAEKEAEMLRDRLQQAKDEASRRRVTESEDKDQEDHGALSRVQRDLAVKEREVERLVAEMKTLRTDRQAESKAKEAELAALRQERDEGNRLVASLEAKLQAQSDYDIIKKVSQISML